YYVLKQVLEVNVDFVWHMENDLKKYDAIILPGGFSYGDYLRAGAIARFSPVMDEVLKSAKKGKTVIGICNGFQILVESGLLPGALITNQKIKFLSREVKIRVESNLSIFTRNYSVGEILNIPIAHKQGNYVASPKVIKNLEGNNQILFRYYPDNEDGNPNGSVNSIAGIVNDKGNILGMMPHPERAAESVLGKADGVKIFESMLGIS
ncbi:MAG: phosphoribosylformylglycinamidine synthase subunit PurQ, partial [Fidelibacterota bacterium]